MAGGDEAGVPLIGMYLWVTVGNGFRFGPRYLLASYWLSLCGFAALLVFVPFWQTHRPIGVGFMLALAVVPLYVLVLLSRLTAQKDAAEQLSNAKSRFVANVSHELRTPLTGVFAVYDLLRMRKMTPDDRELVGMLANAITTLKTSVDAVLQMSKLEAGAERTELRPFNLWFFLQQLAALARPQATSKGLAWHVHIEPDVPCTVYGDPNHLSHVLGNLINNAFKFTPNGSVSLRARCLPSGRIRFEVVDTGIGIPLQHQERLFERFVQVDTSATRRYTGTGLGTSIARDLTELMGGKIGVVSSPGQGSTFWIELPLPAPEPAPANAPWGAQRELLVLGDDSPMQEHVISSLRSLGLSATTGSLSPNDSPCFDAGRYLAALFVTTAAQAATYAEANLRDRAGHICPWIVLAQGYTSTQYSALIRAGAAGLLPSTASLATLRTTLLGLQSRLDVTPTSDAPVVPTAGIVRQLNILLADDNRSNQILLSRILTDAGHTVHTAERGDHAFDQMSSGRIDLAILDLNMPDMTGPDVIKLFRAGSVGGPSLPIIILSADATPAAKIESIEAGANEFLTKPVTAALLLAAIERCVGGSIARANPSTASPADQKPHAPPPSAPILVDPDRLTALRRIAKGERRFLDEYVAAAFNDLEKAIADLRVAAMEGHTTAARDALHIIDGTGASIGAIALVANSKAMRGYLANAHDPDRAAALAELSTTYALTKSAVLASLHEARDSTTRSTTPR
jgi:two-component system sensor histidine kinase RpfC